jgi:hypothetical protein
MSEQYTFELKTERQALEEMTEEDVLQFFRTEGADSLMLLYKLAKAAMNPSPELMPKAACRGTVTYDTETGGWGVSVTCKGDS